VSKEENANFNLWAVSQLIKQYGVKSALVGGIPLDATLNSGRIGMVRKNGTIRDVDALGLGPDEKTIDACNRAIGKISAHQHDFPPVGLEPAHFGEKIPRDHPWTLLSGLRIDEKGRNFLYYGNIQTEVPAITMQPVPMKINGVEFESLPKTTLLWRYYVRSGILKPKDIEKVEQLKSFIAEHPDGEPDSENYLPYMEFAEAVNKKYPGRMWVTRKYWEADYRLGGVFSGSAWLYGLIGLFRKS
jgi:hypothetical protein